MLGQASQSSKSMATPAKRWPLKQEAKSQKLARTKKFKEDKNGVNERLLGPDDRALFKEAKVKELKSFFDHGVWTFQHKDEADPARTLTSRMILKWSKHPDGSPRAKARLIVRGYNDPDALEGTAATSSPTTTRLSRSMVLSLDTDSRLTRLSITEELIPSLW